MVVQAITNALFAKGIVIRMMIAWARCNVKNVLNVLKMRFLVAFKVVMATIAILIIATIQPHGVMVQPLIINFIFKQLKRLQKRNAVPITVFVHLRSKVHRKYQLICPRCNCMKNWIIRIPLHKHSIWGLTWNMVPITIKWRWFGMVLIQATKLNILYLFILIPICLLIQLMRRLR